MKRTALITILLGFLFNCYAQTYYYERIAIVENRVKRDASGDGHFITFTSKGCYDSDKNGNDEGFGFRSYLRTSNDIQDYYGDSYFGKAYYYFSSDRSRLNIKKESDGTVYVYTRRTAPAGVTKSSRQRYYDTPPVIVTPPAGSGGSGSSGGSSGGSSSNTIICKSCHGTGLCDKCYGAKKVVVHIYSGDVVDICPICRGSGHCGVCHGSGKIRY